MLRILPGLIAATIAVPALAQLDPEPDDPAPPALSGSPFTLSGTAAILSDYRFRGVSQTDEGIAAQASLTVTHDSGVYAGAWVSNLDGWGSVGGADAELDLYGGYRGTIGAATLDAGLLWYLYPGSADNSDFAELYANVSRTLGPGTLKLGLNYAPRQQALANVSAAPNSRGQKQDNLYVYADASAALIGTPLTARAHIGYSDGNPGLGPNGRSLSPTGSYVDYLFGVDAGLRNVTVGLAYTDTDVGRAESLRLQPNFSRGEDGTGSIADGALVLSLTAAF